MIVIVVQAGRLHHGVRVLLYSSFDRLRMTNKPGHPELVEW